MGQLVDRFTVSLDTELLAAFDAHIAGRGYENRSEAVRDLIRDLLLQPRLGGTEPGIGFVSFLCDHSRGEVAEQVRDLLAASQSSIRGVLNVTIDRSREVVVVALDASSKEVAAFADSLQSRRGVSYTHSSVIPKDTP